MVTDKAQRNKDIKFALKTGAQITLFILCIALIIDGLIRLHH